MVEAWRRQVDWWQHGLGLVLDGLADELLLGCVRRRDDWPTGREGLSLGELTVRGVLGDQGHRHVELLGSLVDALVRVVLIARLEVAIVHLEGNLACEAHI